MKKDTSWGKVASWYDDVVNDNDSFQKQIILPGLIRLLTPLHGKKVVDLACGQGYFSHAFIEEGAEVIGTDISKELIDIAKKPGKGEFYVKPADDLAFIKTGTIDAVTIVLALQNIKNFQEVIAESKRVLKKEGELILVLNHPAFRVPQHSDWIFDANGNEKGNGTQSRWVDSYISELEIPIVMNPGAEKSAQVHTFSFHRSLQVLTKAFEKQGFGIARIEEWTSHKVSQKGPRQEAEDKARKEIPLFMMIKAKLW